MLWKHSKKCNEEKINHSTDVNNKDTGFNADTDKSTIEYLIKENADFKNIVLDMVKNNTEIQKQLLDILKNKL